MDPRRRRKLRFAAALAATVRRRGAGFVGERDSLVTKCPSKFAAAKRS